MAWEPGDRANLNRLRFDGVVAVRYQKKGCNVELELLSNCIGKKGTDGFKAYRATKKKVAHNANELFAELPVGAAKLSGKLKGNRALRTDYMLAGTLALPAGTSYGHDDLVGECKRATHVVSLIYVGGFSMYAANSNEIDASVSLFGASAGGSSISTAELLNAEGAAEACLQAQESGQENQKCDVPLRIALVPLEGPPSSGGVGSPATGVPAAKPGEMIKLPALTVEHVWSD
jgi:hypothetical protein